MVVQSQVVAKPYQISLSHWYYQKFSMMNMQPLADGFSILIAGFLAGVRNDISPIFSIAETSFS
jgi:hypothetical protein